MPARDDEIAIAKMVVEGSTAALAKQQIGHHAGQPRRGDPRQWGHEEYDRKNYVGYDADRDHYRDELLDRMSGVSFQF